MVRRRFHVTYDKDKGDWKVQDQTGQRASHRAPTKEEAVQKGRKTAQSGGDSSLVIHKKDGKIQEERTYPRKSDPYPPSG